MIELDFGDFKLDNSNLYPTTTYSQIVNPDEDFRTGITSSAQFTFEINALYGDLPEIQNREFKLSVNGKLKGIFIAEKPVKKSENIVSVVSYDRMVYFNIFVDDWLDGLTYPITLMDFLKSLCERCGVPLLNVDIYNADWIIKEKPNIKNVTGLQILQWICEIAACFCVIEASGKLELRWYRENEVEVSGVRSRDIAEYETDKITGLQISSPYITVAVPEALPAENVYILQGNPLIITADEQELYNLGVKIYEKIKDFSYTPFKLSAFAENFGELAAQLMDSDGKLIYDSEGRAFYLSVLSYDVNAGDIIYIRTRSGNLIKAYIMSYTAYGGSFSNIEISATGNKTRSTQIEPYAQVMDFLRNDFITTITRERGIRVFFEDETGESVINPREWYTEINGEKILYIDFSATPPKLVFNGEFGINAKSQFYSKEELTGGYIPLKDSEGHEVIDSNGDKIMVMTDGIINGTIAEMNSTIAEMKLSIEEGFSVSLQDYSTTEQTLTQINGAITSSEKKIDDAMAEMKLSIEEGFSVSLQKNLYELAKITGGYIPLKDSNDNEVLDSNGDKIMVMVDGSISETEERLSAEFNVKFDGLSASFSEEIETLE